MDVSLSLEAPESPVAMSFVLGGVALSVPIAHGAQIARDDVTAAGWEAYTTDASAPKSVHLRLEPTAPDAIHA
jgi:hypothetical protein